VPQQQQQQQQQQQLLSGSDVRTVKTFGEKVNTINV